LVELLRVEFKQSLRVMSQRLRALPSSALLTPEAATHGPRGAGGVLPADAFLTNPERKQACLAFGDVGILIRLTRKAIELERQKTHGGGGGGDGDSDGGDGDGGGAGGGNAATSLAVPCSDFEDAVIKEVEELEPKVVSCMDLVQANVLLATAAPLVPLVITLPSVGGADGDNGHNNQDDDDDDDDDDEVLDDMGQGVSRWLDDLRQLYEEHRRTSALALEHGHIENAMGETPAVEHAVNAQKQLRSALAALPAHAPRILKGQRQQQQLLLAMGRLQRTGEALDSQHAALDDLLWPAIVTAAGTAASHTNHFATVKKVRAEADVHETTLSLHDTGGGAGGGGHGYGYSSPRNIGDSALALSAARDALLQSKVSDVRLERFLNAEGREVGGKVGVSEGRALSLCLSRNILTFLISCLSLFCFCLLCPLRPGSTAGVHGCRRARGGVYGGDGTWGRYGV
jgi:hypothetical protein